MALNIWYGKASSLLFVHVGGEEVFVLGGVGGELGARSDPPLPLVSTSLAF